MAGQEAEIARRLASNSCYHTMFAQAFPGNGTVDFAHVAKALAAFQRTFISFDTPYDAYLRGKTGALSPLAVDGGVVFDRHCRSCHSGRLLTDQEFHRIRSAPGRDQGLAEITMRAADAGSFRTPSLRNVELTGPYLHDGSAKTIGDAVHRHSSISNLDDKQLVQVTAFLLSLTDRRFVTSPRLALPEFACGERL